MHDLPVEVAPPGSGDQRPTHRGGHGLGREPEQLRPVGQRRPDRRGDGCGIRLDRQSIDGAIDVVESAVGLEEEVAGEAELRDPAVALLEVDDDQLASGHLEFAVHASRLGRRVRAAPALRR